jgi:superfamily I DNA/RNA helicase
VLDRYRPLVPKGVRLCETKRQTGLEYKVVFIPRVEELCDRTVGSIWEEDRSRQQIKLYMTMTRARTWLYLLCSRKWPAILKPALAYMSVA